MYVRANCADCCLVELVRVLRQRVLKVSLGATRDSECGMVDLDQVAGSRALTLSEVPPMPRIER